MQHVLVKVTPVVSASAAYTAADQVGGLQTLPGAVAASGDGSILRQVSVVDQAKQKAALTILFFDSSPTIASADNAALDVSDSEMAARCLGSVTIATTDYVDTASNSVATKQVTIPVKARGSSTIYAVASTSGTPTYGSTSDLVLRYHFTLDG